MIFLQLVKYSLILSDLSPAGLNRVVIQEEEYKQSSYKRDSRQPRSQRNNSGTRGGRLRAKSMGHQVNYFDSVFTIICRTFYFMQIHVMG